MKLCQSHYAAAHPSCSHTHTIIHCYEPTQWLVLIGGTFHVFLQSSFIFHSVYIYVLWSFVRAGREIGQMRNQKG